MSIDFNDKVILVTGGTGSFGKQFAKTVLTRFRVRKLIIFSRDEQKQTEMAQADLGRQAQGQRGVIEVVNDAIQHALPLLDGQAQSLAVGPAQPGRGVAQHRADIGSVADEVVQHDSGIPDIGGGQPCTYVPHENP